MDNQYAVLNPWAEVDPLPQHGIAPRPIDMKDKKIGLFHNDKVGAAPILSIIEAKLKEKFPTLTFSRYLRTPNISMAEMPDWLAFVEWVKGLDAVVFAIGD